MYRLGNLMLIFGILIIVLGGIGLVSDIISNGSIIINLIMVIGLILIGAGASIKKKYRG